MHFPSDDELMAGPNAFDDQSIEIDEDALEEEAPGDDAVETDDDDWEDTDSEDEVAGRLQEIKSLRREADAGAGLVMPDYPEDFRAGFACLVGRPNAGKSTLTNALVGQKVAITSGRPQTTRHNVRGVVHRDDAQLVLVDTPGLHRPRTLLGKRLNDLVRETLADVDVIAPVPDDPTSAPTQRMITLTTCNGSATGEWGNDQRWIVHGTLSYWMPRSEGRPSSIVNDPEVN